jgi:diadenosine tetraphosphate (Ap4A) HIT family hydrolase
MTAKRTVLQADAFAWMNENPAAPKTSVITSLPDVSELSDMDLATWKEWFVDSARRVLRWTPDDGVAIFYQSDIRHRGEWIDKGHLVMRAADAETAGVLWHTIVCRKPPGTIALGRPSYSHMICIARAPRAVRHPPPDVMPRAGAMSWSKAMGADACRVACRFLREDTDTEVVVDPFCGRGTVLAVANEMGFDAIGVDVGGKRVRAARNAQP